MNSVTRRSTADILWDILGFLVCLIVGAIFALDCLRIKTVELVKTIPDLGKMIAIAMIIFSFIPGLCILGFYIFTDVQKLSGASRWMSWWWIWLT